MKNDVEKLKSHWLDYQNTGSFIPLLIFLEHSLVETKQLISSLDFEPFPYRRLIEFALSSEADYWASLAVDWLEQGVPINGQIANAINSMVEEKRTSQKTRHRAFSLVKRFEKSNSV
jgi:hypothetical protein